MLRSRNTKLGKQKQHGAVAIEFALLFLVFFAIAYAIIAYSLPFLLTLSFKQVSAEAARAAVQVSPVTASPEDYLHQISRHVHNQVNKSWLPESWVQGDCPAPETGGSWQQLHSLGGKSFGHYQEIRSEPFAPPRYQLNICLQREYSKANAIIPILTVFGVDIPSLPKDEDGNTTLRGRSTIRL